MKIKPLLSKLSLLVMAVFIIGNGYSQTCPAGMVSYWKLQETGGTVFVDEKGNHNALGATSSPIQTQGASGKAQLFTPNSYISVPSHADFNWTATGSYTIELWTNFSTVSAAVEVLIGRDDASNSTHWWIGKTNLGKIMWYNRSTGGSINTTIESNSALSYGQWHHIVAVRDGSAAKNYLYIDNVLQNVGGTTYTISGDLSSTADMSIGGLIENTVPKYFFNGAIDEVAIYNVALNTEQIDGHFNNIKSYQIGYCDGNNPVFLSEPNTFATVGSLYTYDVDASGNPLPTYILLEKPTGMTIDANGLISWTPSSVSQNGHVVVQISNSGATLEQSFNIFVANAPTCRENLIAYWDFNETGNAPYFDNIATYKLTGNASHASGKVGTAMTFNGVSDSLNMKDNTEPSPIFFDFDNVPSFSIELWMKTSVITPAKTMVLVGRDQKTNSTQYWLGVNPDGTVGFYLQDYPATPNIAYIEGGAVLDGAWHHIVATYNATSNDMKLFVDKTNVAQTNKSFLNFGGTVDLNIGCLNTTLDKFWYEGLIDELAFYNAELTAIKIAADFDEGVAGKGACVYNYAPVIVTSPVISVNQGSLYSYKIIATDGKENDITGISAPIKPAWLSLTYNAPDTFATLSGTPTNANVGSHNVTLRVTNGSINIDQAFTVQVVNINDAPVITSTPVAVINEDVAYSYTVTATDIDVSDVLTYSAPVKPTWLTFDAVTHVLSGTPTNDNVDVFDITVRVNDGTVNIDQSYTLTVNNVNDPPEFTTNPVLTVVGNTVYMYEVIATDVDEGDVLTYSIDNASKPSWLTFTPGATSGILTGTAPAQAGSYAVILKANDGHVDAIQAFTITVSAPSAISEIDNSIVNNVYPNPAGDNVYFQFAKTGKTRIEILDITGNLQKLIVADDLNIIEVKISDLSKGIYIYKVYQDGKIGLGKITKK